jgi:hypothetical protein
MTDPHRQAALLAGHEGEREEYEDHLKEVWGADEVVDCDGWFLLYKDGERIGEVEGR